MKIVFLVMFMLIPAIIPAIIIVPAIVPAPPTVTSSSVEIQEKFSDGHISHQLNFSHTHFFSKKIGLGFWAAVNKGWAEAYPSLILKMKKVKIGMGMGIETGFKKPRWGSSISYTTKKMSLYLTVENGKGFWFRGVFSYSIIKSIGIGIITQYSLGLGPRIEIKKGNIVLWMGTMFRGNATTFAGVRYIM